MQLESSLSQGFTHRSVGVGAPKRCVDPWFELGKGKFTFNIMSSISRISISVQAESVTYANSANLGGYISSNFAAKKRAETPISWSSDFLVGVD